MNARFDCACGASVELDDVTPATAELFFGLFTAEHRHDETRAFAYVTRPFPGSSPDEDEDA